MAAAAEWRVERLRMAADFQRAIVAAESERDRLAAEVAAALKVLDPNLPESGIEDAARQVKQAWLTEKGNADSLEAENARLAARVGELEALAEKTKFESEEKIKELEQELRLNLKFYQDQLAILNDHNNKLTETNVEIAKRLAQLRREDPLSK